MNPYEYLFVVISSVALGALIERWLNKHHCQCDNCKETVDSSFVNQMRKTEKRKINKTEKKMLKMMKG
jgi:hypothetical protein